jgi:membrane-bound lytic murein transglycosylase B
LFSYASNKKSQPKHYTVAAVGIFVFATLSLSSIRTYAFEGTTVEVKGVSTNIEKRPIEIVSVGKLKILSYEAPKPKVIEKPKPVIKVRQKGDFTETYKKAAQKYGIPWEILSAVHYVETGQSGDTDVRNKSGATGPMQFMEPTFIAYAQDGDGDGTKLITDVEDSIFTAAKMLSANAGKSGGNISAALYRYNHHLDYVNKVLAIARSFGYKD